MTLFVSLVAAVAQQSFASDAETIATDLAELREEAPDGIESPIEATDEEFAQAVELLRRRERDSAPPFGTIGPPLPIQQDYWGDPAYNSLQGSQFAPPNAAPYQPLSAPSRTRRSPEQQLREAAHQLDRVAHELEMAELFEAADELREAGQRLRQRARPRAEAAKGT